MRAAFRREAKNPILAGLVLLMLTVSPCVSFAQTVKVGDPAPDFSVSLLDGKRTIHLSDFRGRPVLIFAWASW